MKQIYFKEKQRYDNKLALVLLGLFALILIGGAFKSLLASEINYANVIFLFSATSVVIGSIWWLTQLKLKIAISDKKIKAKITPSLFKKQSIAWSEVEKCEIVRTPEAAQWSGGNVSFGQERMLSLNGRNGLAIETKAGESYFIGCQNINALQQALAHFPS